MTVTLRLFFFGLIAFVKQPDGLTVALVNAVTPHAGSGCAAGSASQCPFHAHSPFLTILPNPLSGCADATSFPGLCAWDLSSKVVSFPNPTTPGMTYVDTRGRYIPMIGAKHRLPGDANEAQDFTWVPVMADVTGKTMKVSPNNLTPGASSPTIASLKLTGGAVQACHLADLDLAGEAPVESACAGDCIHTFRFESIDGTIQGSAKQALADGVMASFNFEVDPQNPYVRINIGTDSIKVPPVRCSVNQKAAMCVDVAVTNMPAHDDTCPSIGVDFALLYELGDGMAKSDVCPRLVPHRTSETQVAFALDACSSPLVTSLFRGMALVSPDSRPVCPMGTYGG